jgi:methionine synthase II (cobalamin-independent)
MQRSMTRIRNSHVGRLPSPKGWEDMPERLASAEITDPAVIAAQVTPAIAEIVRRQVEVGIDCIGLVGNRGQPSKLENGNLTYRTPFRRCGWALGSSTMVAEEAGEFSPGTPLRSRLVNS